VLQTGGEGSPFSTGLCYKPVLKALPRPVALTGSCYQPVLKGSCPDNTSSRWAGPFCTSSCYKPVLKGSLTPGRKKAEVFGHFGHRPMPHSVVVHVMCLRIYILDINLITMHTTIVL